MPRQLDTGDSTVSVIWGLALMRVMPETFVQSSVEPVAWCLTSAGLRKCEEGWTRAASPLAGQPGPSVVQRAFALVRWTLPLVL